MPSIIQMRRVVVFGNSAATTTVSGQGTSRQAPVYSPVLGLIDLNSGSTVRQTALPGLDVTEGQ